MYLCVCVCGQDFLKCLVSTTTPSSGCCRLGDAKCSSVSSPFDSAALYNKVQKNPCFSGSCRPMLAESMPVPMGAACDTELSGSRADVPSVPSILKEKSCSRRRNSHIIRFASLAFCMVIGNLRWMVGRRWVGDRWMTCHRLVTCGSQIVVG